MQQNTELPVVTAQCEGKIKGSTRECHRRNSCYRYTSIGVIPSTPWLPKYEYMCIVQDSFFHDVAESSIKSVQEGVMTTNSYKSNGETVAELNFEKSFTSWLEQYPIPITYTVVDGRIATVTVGGEEYYSDGVLTEALWILAQEDFENTEEYQTASALERDGEHQQLQGEYFASCM